MSTWLAYHVAELKAKAALAAEMSRLYPGTGFHVSVDCHVLQAIIEAVELLASRDAERSQE